MPFSNGNVATLSVGGTDISAYVSDATATMERDVKDLPRLGSNPTAHLVGPLSRTYSAEGWYEPAVDGVLRAAMVAEPPVPIAVSLSPQGSGGAIAASCYIASYEVNTPADDPATWSAELVDAGATTA